MVSFRLLPQVLLVVFSVLLGGTMSSSLAQQDAAATLARGFPAVEIRNKTQNTLLATRGSDLFLLPKRDDYVTTWVLEPVGRTGFVRFMSPTSGYYIVINRDRRLALGTLSADDTTGQWELVAAGEGFYQLRNIAFKSLYIHNEPSQLKIDNDELMVGRILSDWSSAKWSFTYSPLDETRSATVAGNPDDQQTGNTQDGGQGNQPQQGPQISINFQNFSQAEVDILVADQSGEEQGMGKLGALQQQVFSGRPGEVWRIAQDGEIVAEMTTSEEAEQQLVFNPSQKTTQAGNDTTQQNEPDIVNVSFQNRSDNKINIYTDDANGQPEFVASVDSNQQAKLQSYPNTVWRLAVGDSWVGEYQASEEPEQTVSYPEGAQTAGRPNTNSQGAQDVTTVVVSFQNRSQNTLNLYIDGADGQPKFVAPVQPNQQAQLESAPGVIWRLAVGQDWVGEYQADADAEQVVAYPDVTPDPGQTAQQGNDGNSDGQSNGQPNQTVSMFFQNASDSVINLYIDTADGQQQFVAPVPAGQQAELPSTSGTVWRLAQGREWVGEVVVGTEPQQLVAFPASAQTGQQQQQTTQGGDVLLTFQNASQQPLNIYVDGDDGKPQFVAGLNPNEEAEFESQPSVIWRLAQNNEWVGDWQASSEPQQTILFPPENQNQAEQPNNDQNSQSLNTQQGQVVAVTFDNASQASIELYVDDAEGKPVFVARVEAGSQLRQGSYPGTVWRLAQNGGWLGEFKATAEPEQGVRYPN